MKRSLMAFCSLCALAAAGNAAIAGEADVIAATARQDGDGQWSFSATVRHADTGWDHYADRFEILSEDGAVLATRVLLHPHETEQPFTRGLSGVTLPPGIRTVVVRAHDSVHGTGGAEVRLELAGAGNRGN